MAKWIFYNDAQKRIMAEWLADRPAHIQEMVRKWPPDELFRLKTTGQYVYVRSYGEDGTVLINIEAEHNRHIVKNPEFAFLYGYPRQVFDIDPNDLEECELPEGVETLSAPLHTDVPTNS